MSGNFRPPRSPYIIWPSLSSTGGLVAQAVRPTAGVPSSRLGHSMWVSWWTKRGLGRFFTGFLPFSPTTNFIPPFLYTHPFRSISSALVMVRQAWSAGTLATHGPIISGLHRISSLDPTFCWTRVEDIYFITIIQKSNSLKTEIMEEKCILLNLCT